MSRNYHIYIACLLFFSLNAARDSHTGIKIVKNKTTLSRENLLEGVKIDEFSAMTCEELQEKIDTYTKLQAKGSKVLEQNAIDGIGLTEAERARREKLQEVFEEQIVHLESQLQKKQKCKWKCWG